MPYPGWFLVIVGLLIVLIGVIWLVGPSIPWLGRLPADIQVERPSFRFYFPLTTCLLLSVVLTLVLWLVNKLRG
jgi:uncharacterized protein YybS (DUF2232 family)